MDFPTLTARVLELAVKIQQIPAPTFKEERRAQFLQQSFLAEGLADVEIDPVGNVYARLPGLGQAHPVVISAHTDTVFPEGTPLEISKSPGKLAGPGIGDNSTGSAGLVGLAWALNRRERGSAGSGLSGDVWLVANMGEEGLGDLRGMRRVVERFGKNPAAYIVLEGMALGQVYHRGLGVQRYRVSLHTRGGHSWVDYGCPSAIHEIAALVSELAALQLPDSPRTTLNVGMIRGGTSINTIAPSADIELDLRSEGAEALSWLVEKVEKMVENRTHQGVETRLEQIGRRPAGVISPDHPLVKLAVKALEEQGIRAHLNIGSTDANVPLSLGLPAICVGLTNGGGAHTTGEWIQTAPLEKGLRQVVRIVEGVFQGL